MSEILISEKQVQSVMTKSSLPVGGYSVNPYVGCTHACKYCYASFMKRFTGHTEPWGTFLDVKNWEPIKDPHKFDGQRIVIGSVTDGYNPQEEHYRRTRRLLEELQGAQAEILVTTKSDLVLRDLDVLSTFPKVTVSWSINTLDEQFKNDMDEAVSIERRLAAMKQVYDKRNPHCMFYLAYLPWYNRCLEYHGEGARTVRPHLAGEPESARTIQTRNHALHCRKISASYATVR